MKRLQAEWKTIGPVKKSRSEALWQRFRAAVRSLLRALRAASRYRARANGCGARGDLSSELEALAAVGSPSRLRSRSVRSQSTDAAVDRLAATRPSRSSRSCDGAARCADAGRPRSPRAASIAIARWRSTIASPHAFAARGRAMAAGVWRHRSGSGREPQEDGNARRCGSRSSRSRSADRRQRPPMRRCRRRRGWRRC